MNVFEFIQWCFRDMLSGLVTIALLAGLGNTLVDLTRALRKRDR